MASYGYSAQAAPGKHPQPAAYASHAPTAPPGTFSSGTKIQVGSHRVVIQKYLSEGGFAHVYLVKLPQPVGGTDQAVLKRVAVPDKDTLRGMRTEVETMKRLKGHRPIVTYIDSHASEMRGGGYEVFLLMEYCDGGGLIDFMNTRLQHRLTEPEILNIFTDVAEGVACMHYLRPPLLHRDLKVENVLITMVGSKRKFKVCDFGSAASPKAAPTTVVECRLIEEDVQKHTTLQYRSPEMVDVYRKQPIDEKSDIWALGVLLYKLCYYTTPFEEQGQLAIMNASYRFPSYPVFSDKLKKLIASMLRENPQSRPNIYQVVREGCKMQGREVPIKDIYSNPAHSKTQPRTEPAADSSAQKPTPVVGAVYSPQRPKEQAIPDVVPMRRGRVPVSTSASQLKQAPAPQHKPKPTPSPQRVNGDPFAALDSRKGGGQADELSSRFPTLDQFDLLHHQGRGFDFDSPSSPGQGAPAAKEANNNVPQQQADDAFVAPTSNIPSVAERQRAISGTSPAPSQAKATPPPAGYTGQKPASAPPRPAEMSRAQSIITSNPELQAISSKSSQYVSTGTMTTPPRQGAPIYRFPPTDQKRPAALQADPTPQSWSRREEKPAAAQKPTVAQAQGHIRHPSSSRPSLEGGRPSTDLLGLTNTAHGVPGSIRRPSSTHLESNMDFLRERETAKPQSSGHQRVPSMGYKPPQDSVLEDNTNIESNVDFLRSMEDGGRKGDRGSKHSKRGSISSISGTKNILSGKFGDAFKRFEATNPPAEPQPEPARTPSPLKVDDRPELTPIAGSEATDGRSDDGRLLDNTDNDVSPEVRREMERRQLEEEERRVEAAAAEYRQRAARKNGPAPPPKPTGGSARAVSIQNRVQSLLSEEQKSAANVPRTAHGYGAYTDSAADQPEKRLPDIPRKPVGTGSRGIPSRNPTSGFGPIPSRTVAPSPPVGPKPGTGAKPGPPTAPKKPAHLNNIPTGARPGSPSKQASHQEAVSSGFSLDMTPGQKEEYIQDFTKRYPSLGAIEMVERDLGAASRTAGR